MSKEQASSKFEWRWGDLLHPFLLKRRYDEWKFYITLEEAIESRSLRPGFMQTLLSNLKEDEVKEKEALLLRRARNSSRIGFYSTDFTLLNHNKELKEVREYLTHWIFEADKSKLMMFFRCVEQAQERFNFKGEVESLAFFIEDDLIDPKTPKSTTHEVRFICANHDWHCVAFEILKTTTRTFDPIST